MSAAAGAKNHHSRLPLAASSLGVPAPISWRITKPRLSPAPWIKERFWTWSRRHKESGAGRHGRG